MKIQIRLAQLARQKAVREDRDISITVISEETGLNRNTVSDMWNNKRLKRLDLRTVETLCEYLNCRFDELITEIEDDTESNGVPLPFHFAS